MLYVIGLHFKSHGLSHVCLETVCSESSDDLGVFSATLMQ